MELFDSIYQGDVPTRLYCVVRYRISTESMNNIEGNSSGKISLASAEVIYSAGSFIW